MQNIQFSTSNVNSTNLFSKSTNKVDKTTTNTNKSDSIDISASSRAFKKIDDFLNLGKPDRLNTDDLNPEEEKEFLKMLSSLLKQGVVGYEVLEVNGKPEKHFIVNQIGDQRIKGAKLYTKNDYYRNR